MKPSEAGRILTAAAHFDNRNPTPEAAAAWAAAFTHAGIPLNADVETAVVAHYAESTEFLKPADVIRRVKAVRRERLRRAGDPDLPSELSYEATQEWRRRWVQLVAAGGSPGEARVRADAECGVVRAELKARPVGRLLAGRRS